MEKTVKELFYVIEKHKGVKPKAPAITYLLIIFKRKRFI